MFIEDRFTEFENSSAKLLDGTTTLTYAELCRRSRVIARFLNASGISSGDRVGVAVQDDVEVAVIFLSCLRIGVSVLVLDPNSKTKEAVDVLRRCKLKALFIDPAAEMLWSTPSEWSEIVPHVWTVQKQTKKLISRLLGAKKGEAETKKATYPDCLKAFGNEEPGRSVPMSTISADSEGLLLATSGTTGSPKILKLSIGNLIAAAITTSRRLAIHNNSRVMDLLPFTHYDGIISGLFTSFWNGGTLIRSGPFAVTMLPDIFDSIYKYRATHLLLTPSILALMIRLDAALKQTFESEDFQLVVSVAATLPPTVWADFERKTGKMVVNVYGLSETGNNLFAGPDPESHCIGSIGMPVDCSAMVINEKGEPAMAQEIGELLLQGQSITAGYLDQPVITHKIGDEDWFATGDLARVDQNGVFWLAGRKKNIIIVGGRNVYPDEVNDAVLTHPSVLEVATVGLPDEIWGERVVSCVVTKQKIPSDAILQHAAQHLSDYKVPREVHIVQELPKGRSGKVLTDVLISQLQQGMVEMNTKSLQQVEEQILHLAAQSFRVPATDLSLRTTPQNCSRWDSVAHMDFVVNMETKFGIELMPRDVIQITTLEAAVNIIRDKLPS